MKSDLLTTEELARHFQVSRRTILDWVRDGAIPVIRPSPKVLRFDPVAVADAVTVRRAEEVSQ
jgi:excisionase family DNA binding protein